MNSQPTYARLNIVMAMMLTIAAHQAAAQTNLIVNGGFETGNLSGWTVENSQTMGGNYDGSATAAVGSYYINGNSGTSPQSGVYAPGPVTGNYYAISDMTGPGNHALMQSFFVPFGSTSVTLSFNMYVYDYAGAGGAVDPTGLDWTTGGSNPTRPNQYASVDLLNSGASAFTTTSGVIHNFYAGVDPEAALGLAPVWRNYSYNITSFVTPGNTYELRFGEVDNEFVLNQGIDNVSVISTGSSSVSPEPTTGNFAIVPIVAALAICIRRRRRRIGSFGGKQWTL